MILPDVNVLVYAHHEDSPDHEPFRIWWEKTVNGPRGFAVADLVLSGFVHVVTHPRLFDHPLPTAAALDAVEAIRGRPNCTVLAPGGRHWAIFSHLCRHTRAKGNAIPDAYLAALAIETGSELVTADRGFARFPGLAVRHPLDEFDT